MIRFLCFMLGLLFLMRSDSVAQKKVRSEVQTMLMILNNSHTKAIFRDSTLFVYVINGNGTISEYRDCAEIANAKRLVVVTKKGIQEELIKKTQ